MFIKKDLGFILGRMGIHKRVLNKGLIKLDSHVNKIHLAAAHLGLCGAISAACVDVSSSPSLGELWDGSDDWAWYSRWP